MIVIVDYGLGNLASIRNMLHRIGRDAVICSDLAEVAAADYLILPGVGAFDTGMKALNQRGLGPVLQGKARAGTPLLGICLGMQLLSRGSEEGAEPGLGLISADTVRFRFDGLPDPPRVPHMGWNIVTPRPGAALFPAAAADLRYYFVHSYHVRCDDANDVAATAWHGLPVTAAVERGNVLGTQFHPEKSHRFGRELLARFLTL